jgi:hypothetical protein
MKAEDALFITFNKFARPYISGDIQQQRGFGSVSVLHKLIKKSPGRRVGYATQLPKR